MCFLAVLAGYEGRASADGGGGRALQLAAAEKPAFQNIDAATFDSMRKDTNAVVLDVRTKQEFDAGHVPGAVLVDVNAKDFKEKAAKLDKSKTYLVHCGAGVRSVRACQTLEPLGFSRLFNLEGGFKAWTKAGNKPEK